MDFSRIDKLDLSHALTQIKKYRQLRKSIGKRSLEIFRKLSSPSPALRVELADMSYRETAEPRIVWLYRQYFWVEVDLSQVIWKSNNRLISGIRLYHNDDMIDVSFQNIKTKVLS